MITLTPTQRTDIIKIAVATFGVAPGGYMNVLTQMFFDAGSDLTAFANALTATDAFKSQAGYTVFSTNAESAAKMAAAYGLTDITTADSAGKAAYDFFLANLNAEVPMGTLFVAANEFLAAQPADSAFADVAKMLANKAAVAEYYTVNLAGTSTDLGQLASVVSSVTAASDVSTPEAMAAIIAASAAGTTGQTFTLTTGVDTVTGTSANDTINGTDTTITGLDSIDGGAGTDTFNILDAAGGTAVTGITVENVENVVGRSVGIQTIDASAWTGLTSLSSTQSTVLSLTGAATTAITASGATTSADVNGGSTQTISAAGVASVDSDGAAGAVTVTHTGTTGAIAVDDGTDVSVTSSSAGAITIGADAAATGTVTVVATGQTTADINVDGGTDSSVTATIAATDDAVAGGDIKVGANTAPTGTNTIVQNLTSTGGDADADDLTAANITAEGGTSIDITVNSTSTAADETADGDIVNGTIGVTGTTATTSVSVVQNNTATTFTKAAVAATNESTVVTFAAMTATQTLIINGLTFTASKNLTANEVAEAFAGLTAADTQDAGGPTSNGVYTGAFDAAVWTTGAAAANVVTFTAQDDAEDDITFGGTATAPTQVKTAGVAVVDAITSTNTVTAGAVTVTEGGDASIATITLDGYGASSDIVGAGALTTLNLSNGASALTVDAAVTTLALNLDGVTGALDLDDSGDAANATLTTLNVTTSGSASASAVTAAAVTAGTITAGADLNLTGSTFTALETLAITGAGDVTVDGAVDGTLTSIDASGSTGDIVAAVDAATAAYTGSAGSDTVTLNSTDVDKAVALNAGDDTLVIATGTVASDVTVDATGGAGTDTLSMGFADAVAVSADTDFDAVVTGFERLTITGVVGANDAANTAYTVDLDNLTYNYVTTSGTYSDADPEADSLVLDNMASGGTVVTTATGLVTVNVKDAATGAADSLNVMAQAAINGTLTAANVESIAITADNNNGTASDAMTMTLVATSATSITVTGADDLNLTNVGNTALTSIDASAMTGNLTVVDAGSTLTITGGAGNDNLTAVGSGDTLVGGAGNDTLTGANLTTLTGGAGNDTFVVNIPTNVNSYSTIADISSGDIIQLTAGETFVSAVITLADTAVFQDYANAAVNQLATNDEDAAWFQYSGNTYVVINDNQADAIDADFESGADAIIKITGTVDLSTASYNQTDGTLEIA